MITFRRNPPARSLPSRQVHLPSQANTRPNTRRTPRRSPPIGALAVGDLLRSIERFLQETGMAASRFGRDAVGDPHLVFDLRKGREVKHDVSVRALMHISKTHLDAAKKAKAIAAMADLHQEGC